MLVIAQDENFRNNKQCFAQWFHKMNEFSELRMSEAQNHRAGN